MNKYKQINSHRLSSYSHRQFWCFILISVALDIAKTNCQWTKATNIHSVTSSYLKPVLQAANLHPHLPQFITHAPHLEVKLMPLTNHYTMCLKHECKVLSRFKMNSRESLLTDSISKARQSYGTPGVTYVLGEVVAAVTHVDESGNACHYVQNRWWKRCGHNLTQVINDIIHATGDH